MNKSLTSEEKLFESWFRLITGFQSYRWQNRLFLHFLSGDLPTSLDIPTGLGKTSVMLIWLLARAFNPMLPRRLIYVVDRRAVVDQATQTAIDLRNALENQAELAELNKLLGLNAAKLTISTLHGQFVDNREWLSDPVLPAIVVGTIDMIGSRLLFEGYGVSRGMRRYHAGFLGVDTLCILDEAHLSPAFAALLSTLSSNVNFHTQNAQLRKLIPPFKFLPLSANGKNPNSQTFQLSQNEKQEFEINKRLVAEKYLSMEIAEAGDELSELITDKAWELRGVNNRILIFCDRREHAKKIADNLKSLAKKTKRTANISINLLVSGRRIRERLELTEWLARTGFLAGAKQNSGIPAFLIATSAGEVGIDLDADHMICDLVAFERMMQRFGRVNRRGDHRSTIYVTDVPPKLPKNTLSSDKLQALIALNAPFYAGLEVLKKLPLTPIGLYDASPQAMLNLKEQAAADSFLAENIKKSSGEEALKPELSRAVVDAWSMTSLEEHPGRPGVEPWLRGWRDKDEPETIIVWREFLPWRKAEKEPAMHEVNAFFTAAPIHFIETLQAPTVEIVDFIVKRVESLLSAKNPVVQIDPESPAALILNSAGKFEKPEHSLTFARLRSIEKYELRRLLNDKHIVVTRLLGGLAEGLLSSETDNLPITLDANWPAFELKETIGYRILLSEIKNNNCYEGWRTIHSYLLQDSVDEEENPWRLIVQAYRGLDAQGHGDPAVAYATQSLVEHHDWAGKEIEELALVLGLPEDYVQMLSTAIRHHDLGKDRELWQSAMNAPKQGRPYAKTTGNGNLRSLDGYRHEFGSLGDVAYIEAITRLPTELKDLALHCIASHHGYGCPVIAAIDPNAPPSALVERALETAMRFARLQRFWGPWGLAWWEALFRSADQRASRKLDAHRQMENN